MAIQVLGEADSSDGTWQVWYDDVNLTVGHTCTSGTKHHLSLSVTRVSNQQTFTKDVSADLDQGPVVDISNVKNNEVPAHVKGQPYPFLFSGVWS